MSNGSLGAHRVRESFNPSGNPNVDKIKRYTADLIDLCDGLKHLDPRCVALAQTAYEEAAMWAVKAATTEAKPNQAMGLQQGMADIQQHQGAGDAARQRSST